MRPQTQRDSVVCAARRWVGTPYHHKGRIHGVGVDCAQLLIEVFAEAELVERFDPGHYEHDWCLHRSEERYLGYIEEHMARLDAVETPLAERLEFSALPGDVLVWKRGRTFSHGAIVTDWPFMVHAYHPSQVVEEVSAYGTPMAVAPMRHYSFWGPE